MPSLYQRFVVDLMEFGWVVALMGWVVCGSKFSTLRWVGLFWVEIGSMDNSEGNAFGFVCLFPLYLLNQPTFDLDF